MGDGRRAPLYSGLTLVSRRGLEASEWLQEGDVRVVLFAPADGRLAMALDREELRGALRLLTPLLGPLPYGPELRVAEVPLGFLGFEPPASILLSERLPDEPPVDYARPAPHSLVHELVHQWAGDRTTLSETRDVVWKEAVAEYLTYLVEEQYGATGEAAASRAGWWQLARLGLYWPVPLDPGLPPIVIVTNAYSAGTMILFIQLETLLGRAAVLRAIQRLLAVAGVSSLGDLRADLEHEAGVDLGTYWAAWVEGEGTPPRPVLRVEADASTVRVAQVQDEPPLPCEVVVDVTGPGGTQRLRARFDLNAPERELAVVHAVGAPASVTIDPEKSLLWLPAR